MIKPMGRIEPKDHSSFFFGKPVLANWIDLYWAYFPNEPVHI